MPSKQDETNIISITRTEDVAPDVFFAEQGALHPGGLIVVIAIAAILSDSIGYELGAASWTLEKRECQ